MLRKEFPARFCRSVGRDGPLLFRDPGRTFALPEGPTQA
ncbi:hypothetical protein BSU04_39320 [Caballeronia sordidicola]|jgi:hypothetical protein|uniref:Uncharacterized protein n=1 Tax=Caballeronia sordidicola TaxID=196367 RepID=A0A226WP61_CABSO|nr:hypothetical protein BSU04_39320 [Caballeronia sordidicola]